MSLKAKIGICEGCGHERMLISRKCALCHRKRFRSYNAMPKFKKPKPTGRLEFYKGIWEKRAHVSYMSGEPILAFDHWCFAHVLPHGTYTRWEFEEKNIILLTRKEHQDSHSIAKSDLIKRDPRWEKVFDLRDKLQREYNGAE